MTNLAMAILLALTSSARADAIPACPRHQHPVFHPAPPGAMHHGGAHCEADRAGPRETSRRDPEHRRDRHDQRSTMSCAVAPTARGGTVPFVLATLVIAACTRRRPR